MSLQLGLDDVVGLCRGGRRGAVWAEDQGVPTLEGDQHLVGVGRHGLGDRCHGEDDADRAGVLGDVALDVDTEQPRAGLADQRRVHAPRPEEDLVGLVLDATDAGLGDGGGGQLVGPRRDGSRDVVEQAVDPLLVPLGEGLLGRHGLGDHRIDDRIVALDEKGVDVLFVDRAHAPRRRLAEEPGEAETVGGM